MANITYTDVQNSMKKLPKPSRLWLEGRNLLIIMTTNEKDINDYRHMINGYLIALVDLDIISPNDVINLYNWYADERSI